MVHDDELKMVTMCMTIIMVMMVVMRMMMVKSSHLIYIALLTIQIVTKHCTISK